MTAYLRQRRTARSTGTVVEVYDAEHPGSVFDASEGRWVTICEHGSMVAHSTLALARWFAPVPEEWCEECHMNVA